MKVVFDDEQLKKRVAEKVEGPKENKVQDHTYFARSNNEGKKAKTTKKGKRRETEARTGYCGVPGYCGPEKHEASNAIKQARENARKQEKNGLTQHNTGTKNIDEGNQPNKRN